MSIATKKSKVEHYDPSVGSLNPQDHFTYLCKSNDLEALKSGIDMFHLDPCAKTSCGRTPLYIACEHGQTAVFSYLLTLGADVTIPCQNKNTCLIAASKGGHLELTRYILTNTRVPIDEKGNRDKTALHHAAERDHVSIVKCLLYHGANANAKCKRGRTALDYACLLENLESVQALVGGGASIFDEEAQPASSALTLASRIGHLEIVKVLIEEIKKTSPNQPFGYDALLAACYLGDARMVKLLIESGVETDSPHTVYVTAQTLIVEYEHEVFDGPLSAASSTGRLEVIKYLLDAGFDIEKIDEKGCTPLMCAIREDRADTANLLIDRGADVSRPAKNGATPLHESISAGYLELTRLLIERGAPINARDAEGRTPLYLAIMYDLTKHVELLLEHGANPLQQTVFGHNAIHMTASKGRVEILELLAKNPSLQEIDVEDNNGFTPLLTAARHGNILVAEFLAKKGCDPNIEFEESISSWEIDLYDCAEVEDIRPLYIAYIKAGSLPSPIIFERMRSNYLYSGLAGLFEKVFFEARKVPVLSLLLAAREKNPESPFSKEYLPLDIFKEIFRLTRRVCLEFEWEELFKKEN